MKIRWFVALCLGLWVCSIALAESEVDYYAVYMEGKKVGRAVQTRTEGDGKVSTSQEVSLSIQRGGMPISLYTKESSLETAKGEPISFESSMDLGIMKMLVTGEVKGDQAVMTISSMGQQQTQTVDWPRNAVMSEGLRLLGLKKGLKEGTTYTAKVFSPTQMSALDVEVTVGAKERIDLLGRVVDAIKVRNKFVVQGAGELESASYVDDEGNLLKDIVPMLGMNIEMIICSKEFAMSENDVFEFIDKMFVDSPQPMEDIRGLGSATYTLSPKADTQKLVLPSNGQQSVEPLDSGGVKVTVVAAEMPTGVAMPYKGKDARAVEALKPSAFVQSDRPEIVKLAREAAGNTKDAGEAAKRIEGFVAEYIDDKGLSVGYASAAEVAASRQGDCTEFAVLTAALCRAVGIPAEVVSGVAYIDEFAGVRNKFGGHAWTQVYVGDRWVALDAAFKSGGRGGFDVGHITLAQGNGDPGGFFELATTMGKFTIDKIEPQK